MNQSAGVGGFIVGTLVGQFAGAWVYWRTRNALEGHAGRELWAGTAAGLLTAVVATAIYIPLGAHLWLAGAGAPWTAAAFLGACIGICQGVLFRGRPLGRTPGKSMGSGSAP